VGRPVDAPLEATRLGSYEIVRKLARGGMAELFLARTLGPEGFAKLVVLKKILPSYAENPKFVRLFLDEAKLVAQMEHPHIAQVYDMGKAGNDYFFAMEYVHGQDARAVWRRAARLQKPIPIALAVHITRNIAAALHYAHERTRDDGALLDIVHRDVSPQNILLSYDGAVKLVDFGVAKAASSTVKTRTGALKGKISYMSPEQAKGASIDRRSDVFSLGIVLWELLTGRRLYKADNDLATLQMIINSKPHPPSHVRPDCPAQLDAIVLRALEADVSQRYQSAEQMQNELAAVAREYRYDESTSALRRFMEELFEDELKVWHDAHAQGHTLIDHVAAQPTLILPLSETDLSDPEDDDLEDDEGSQADSDLGTKSPSTLDSLPPTVPRRMRPDPAEDIPTQPIGVQALRPSQPVPTIQLSVPPPPAYASPPFGIGRVSTPAAPFPVAPAEWRPRTEPSTGLASAQEKATKHVLIACSVLFALIVLFALAVGER
jgi:eukaryotic-like serine/threonine-protein kinase